MVTCDFCGTPAQAPISAAAAAPALDVPDDTTTRDQVPMTWVTSVENGHRRVYCDRCSREHLRAIESKLDAEWW